MTKKTKALLRLKHITPYVMIGGAVVGFGTAIYTSAKKSSKLKDAITTMEDDNTVTIEEVAQFADNQEYCTIPEYDKLVVTKLDYIKVFTKEMWLPMTIFAASSLSLIFGVRMLNGRIVALRHAVIATSANTAAILKNVEDQFGKEYREELENMTPVIEVDADGYTTNKPTANELHGQWFESSNSFVTDDESWNQAYIDDAIKRSEIMMSQRGYVTMNEVFDLLGFDRTRYGANMGWVDFIDLKDEVINETILIEGMPMKVPSHYISWKNPKYIYNEIEYNLLGGI